MKKNENDIIFSKTIKAGKRIYYLDVKENRKGELFLVITESKQVTVNTGDKPGQAFEKHKIFLYREDFNNFFESLGQIVEYIERNSPSSTKQTTQIQNITQVLTSEENALANSLCSITSLDDFLHETSESKSEIHTNE